MIEGFRSRRVFVFWFLVMLGTIGVSACGQQEVEATPIPTVRPSSTPRPSPTTVPTPTSTPVPGPTSLPAGLENGSKWELDEVRTDELVVVVTSNMTIERYPAVFVRVDTGEQADVYCASPLDTEFELGVVYTYHFGGFYPPGYPEGELAYFHLIQG